MYEEFFPKRLYQLRIKKGISAREMSLSLGQNAGYINNIETGKALPSMANFFYICEYLEVSPKEFFDSGSYDPKEINEIFDNLKKIDPDLISNFSSIIKALSILEDPDRRKKSHSSNKSSNF